MRTVRHFLGMTLVCIVALPSKAQEPQVLRLWPGQAPGETQKLAPESDTSKATDHQVAGKPLIRLGNVSEPSVTIYRPSPNKDVGAAVLVCPGGGYHILAMDLEGTEVCEWLNSIGVTAALLKYRVPRREGREPHDAPLQDAQRALNLLRSNASSLGIDPKRIGCLGFSAGGNLCALLSTSFSELQYPVVDDADKLVPRPDFSLLIYPAYLVEEKDKSKLATNFKLTKDTPPMFLTMAQDDPLGCENVLVPAMELSKLKVPASVHLFPTGGHGYGLRPTENPATHWPDRARDWLNEMNAAK